MQPQPPPFPVEIQQLLLRKWPDANFHVMNYCYDASVISAASFPVANLHTFGLYAQLPDGNVHDLLFSAKRLSTLRLDPISDQLDLSNKIGRLPPLTCLSVGFYWPYNLGSNAIADIWDFSQLKELVLNDIKPSVILKTMSTAKFPNLRNLLYGTIGTNLRVTCFRIQLYLQSLLAAWIL